MRPGPPRPGRAARAVQVGAGLLALVTGVVLTVPVGAGTWPLAQLVAFRPLLAIGLLTAAGVLVLARRARRTLLPAAAVLAAAAIAQAGVLVVRSVPVPAVHGPGADDGTTVVLTFNTLSVVTPDVLADLVVAQDAHVVVLPETTPATAEALVRLLPDPAAWQVLTAASTHPRVPGTALVVHTDVGTYPRARSLGTTLGSLVAEPEGDGPTLVAAHPLAPAVRGAMAGWAAETARVVSLCELPGVVVVGDLNSTLDHPALTGLDGCVDAARAAGAAARGTWPARVPSALAAPIDHVLVDPDAWRVVDARVLPATGGSDHRPLVVTLAPGSAAG